MRRVLLALTGGMLSLVACGGSGEFSGFPPTNDAGSTDDRARDSVGNGGDGSSIDAEGGGGGAGDAGGSDGPTGRGDTSVTDAPAADRADTSVGDVSSDAPGVPDGGPVDTGSLDNGTIDSLGDAGCTGPTSCYGGPRGELSVPATACRAGISYCIGGSYGACVGEVRPTPESCNGIDDDCNGAIDDGLGNFSCGVGACKNTVAACVSGLPNTCTPLPGSVGETCGDNIDNNCNGIVDEGCGCTYVSPLGNDSTGTGSASLPFLTISKAITAAGTNSLPLQVCVGGTATCAGTPATATYTESVQMRDGVSVLGGYSPVGATSWVRANGCTTAIQAVDTNGLVFGHNVTTPTTLDGFVVNGFASGINAAILVDGSTGAIIQNVTVNGGAGTDSAGIIVQRGGGMRATPLIRDAAINGGTGSSTAIGVKVTESSPTLSRNCSTFDGAGRCTSWGCFNATRFVRGRTSGNGTPGAKTYAVNLQDAAGTVIDTSALCSFDGQGDVAGLHIAGSSAGILIRQNQIVAPGGMTANVNGVGVWMEACGGASPWIVDNSVIAGQSRTLGGRADGIRAVGDCHPRIDRNQRIVGGEESANNDAIGVYCAKDANSSVSSRCTILDNVAIQGSSAGFPPTSTGVKCDAGACARLERNRITGNQGVNTFGVVLNGASTFVDRNMIDAGCTTGAGVGFLSIDAPARVQNNVIRGASSCTPTGGALRSPTSTDAARVQIGSTLAEIDLHSNTLLAVGGTGVACVGRALAFELLGGATPGGPRGVVRNNILHAGICATTLGLVEVAATADPRILENNDIWYSTAPTALYRDEGTTDLTTIGAVNGLADITSAANVSTDPLFTGATNYHIIAGSPCRNTGTASGAATYDWENDARPQEGAFDIGADEFRP